MRVIPLALAALFAAAPTFAQPHEAHHGPEGGRFSPPAGRAEEHRAGHAARNAEREMEHARRDAEAGDYQGAAAAERRARAEAEDARHHARDTRRERGVDRGGHRDRH